MDQEKLEKILKDIDYDKLNASLKDYKHYIIKYTAKLKRLALIILENYPQINFNPNYIVDIHPNRTIENVTDFFFEISPDYAGRFLNILSEVGLTSDETSKGKCTVIFQKKGRNRSYNTGRIELNLEDKIRDTYALMHETTHKIMRPYKQVSILRAIIPEVPPISLEFVLYDYLKNKSLQCSDSETLTKDIGEYIIYRFTGTSNNAVRLLIECELITLHQNNGHIDEEILKNYINNLSDEYPVMKTMMQRYFLYQIKKMSKGKMTTGFSTSLRYVLGTLIACDFRAKIKDDLREIQNILAINDLLGTSDDELSETLAQLKSLGLTFFGEIDTSLTDPEEITNDEHFLDFDDELLQRYEENFKSALQEFFGQNIEQNQKTNIISPITTKS